MVHALQEAWRVLRPDSCLIDLHPIPQHAQVGMVRGECFVVQWKTEESLESYRAASRALQIAVEMKLFSRGPSGRFPCTMVFHSYQDLREWLVDWCESGSTDQVDEIVNRIETARAQSEPAGQIVAKVPLMLQVFTKRSGLP